MYLAHPVSETSKEVYWCLLISDCPAMRVVREGWRLLLLWRKDCHCIPIYYWMMYCHSLCQCLWAKHVNWIGKEEDNTLTLTHSHWLIHCCHCMSVQWMIWTYCYCISSVWGHSAAMKGAFYGWANDYDISMVCIMWSLPICLSSSEVVHYAIVRWPICQVHLEYNFNALECMGSEFLQWIQYNANQINTQSETSAGMVAIPQYDIH